jgi:hypothetical protein
MVDMRVDERDQGPVPFDQFEIERHAASEPYARFDGETYKAVLSQV